MPVPIDVRFQRALRKYKPSWEKLDLDPLEYPLLGQIRDGQSALLTRSFGNEERKFHVDFIDLPTLDACIFADPEESIVFVGLTRLLIDELLRLADALASSMQVRTLIGIPTNSSPLPEFADVLFTLELVFIIGHEAGHYVYGHVAENSMWFEYSGQDLDVDGRLQGHTDELKADAYAMRELCGRMLDGETGGLLELLPRNGTYGPDEISSMLVMAATAVFLLHLTHAQPKVDLSRDKHPPIVLRQHRILDVMHSWLAARGKSIADMTGARRHAIMQAVGKALPESLWTLWNAQVDLLESAAGLQYLDELVNVEKQRRE